MLAASTRLGPYEIVAPLGAGGMGEVYRARDTRLGRDVAVKVLPQAFAHDPDRRDRFEREARAVAALSHPNILAIHDYGTNEAGTYAVMELLEGETLRSSLARGPLPWRKAVEIGIAIAEGLAAAHAKSIVHRDLKPENLFLTVDGQVKILDFGLARVEPPSAQDVATRSYFSAPTEPGTVMGTAGYMSPEQVRGQVVGARSDVFSLGCVLYEMVTAKRPFARTTAVETQTAILHDDPPELNDSGKRVPPELERVIRHCLEKNSEERFQSARDLAFALRAALTDSDTSRATAARLGLPRPHWRVAALALLVLAGGSLYLYLRDGKQNNGGPGPQRSQLVDSLAVLPFAHGGGDADAEFLGDGITISLTNSLAKLRDLKVRPFSAVSRYKGRETDAPAAGRELQVQAVLMGTIQKRGEDLVISVELVEVSENKQIWGQRYDRKFANLLAVQQEIAQDITATLRLRPTGEETKQLAKRPTEDLEAFRFYILGRVEWNKRTKKALQRGVDYFEQAKQKDPNYALAYAGLADCYNLLNEYGGAPAKESFPKAKAAAQKALAIDESLAEAHTSLAYCLAFHEWDWREADREYRRALALNPSYATAHQWYGECLIILGRTEEGLAHLRRAQELDPSALIIPGLTGWALYNNRQYDQAVGIFRKILALDGQFIQARSFLGWTYAEMGMYAEALAEFQKARLLDDNPEFLGGIGYVHAVAGRKVEAHKVLDDLKELSSRRHVSPCLLAFIHAALGEVDPALQELEKAYQDRSGWLAYAKVDPKYDKLRSDPRFTDLLRRLGLAAKAPARDGGG
jgi:eukaryotic-like serine/threonine-protein kinase